MHMPVFVQQHIVWLNIPVHYALCVYVSERTPQRCYPELHGVFGKGLA